MGIHALKNHYPAQPAGKTARIAQGPKTAVALTKRLVNKSFQSSYTDIADAEADGQTLLFGSEFAQEAVRRFVDKEPPLYDWDKMDDD